MARVSVGLGTLPVSVGWVARGRGCPIVVAAPGYWRPWAWVPHGWVPASVSTHRRGHGCLAPPPPPPQEHFNYYSLDPALGHLVFSLKYDEQEHLHLLLR